MAWWIVYFIGVVATIFLSGAAYNEKMIKKPDYVSFLFSSYVIITFWFVTLPILFFLVIIALLLENIRMGKDN